MSESRFWSKLLFTFTIILTKNSLSQSHNYVLQNKQNCWSRFKILSRGHLVYYRLKGAKQESFADKCTDTLNIEPYVQ